MLVFHFFLFFFSFSDLASIYTPTSSFHAVHLISKTDETRFFFLAIRKRRPLVICFPRWRGGEANSGRIWDECVFFTHNYERWIDFPDFLAITAQNEDRLSAHVNIWIVILVSNYTVRKKREWRGNVRLGWVICWRADGHTSRLETVGMCGCACRAVLK